jgi:hypothetical protein
MALAIGREFATFVHDETGYWGAYPPEIPVSVGDYLEFTSKGEINRLGTSLDWPGWKKEFPIETVDIKSPRLRYTSHARLDLIATASGGVSVAGGAAVSAGVKLTFSGKAGFVMDYRPTKLRRYRSVEAVRSWLLALAKNGKFPPGRALVMEVRTAESATVVMSKEAASTVVLNASASIPVTEAALDLADPTLGLSATTERGSALTSFAQASTPLYRVVLVRKSWLGKYHAELQAAGQESDTTDAFSTDPFEDNPLDDDV